MLGGGSEGCLVTCWFWFACGFGVVCDFRFGFGLLIWCDNMTFGFGCIWWFLGVSGYWLLVLCLWF